MTPQEINVAIAEACGFFDIREDVTGFFGWRKGYHQPTTYYKAKENCTLSPIPDYFNDLNAMHEAEKTLTPNQQIRFIHNLGLEVLKLCPLAGDYWMAHELDCWTMSRATAPQRAEAFLRTIGKWKE